MPFQRYLQQPSDPSHYPLYDDDDDHNHQAFSHAVHFQIPPFIYTGAPTLAHGGGAEVLPAAMFNPHDSLASSWLVNNGFSPNNPLTHPSDFSFPSYAQPQPSLSPPPRPPSPSVPHDLSMFLSSPPSDHVPPHTDAAAAAAAIAAPSPLGLPVYSASGFDLLSILGRVATRPHPRVVLGPVDLTCSFVVVDVRRHDHPIVYCSPSFCRLTGYDEHQVLGRNCRFLQGPDGIVHRGEQRRFTSHDSVVHLKKSLSADKECQTSIINYKKDGSAFINLVTVIPVAGGVTGAPHEEHDVVYHVGFQVDLTEQPNAILQKLRDGSYIVNYSSHTTRHSHSSLLHPIQPGPFPSISLRDSSTKKSHIIPQTVMSKDLKKLLHDPKFIGSLPISSSTTVPTPLSSDKSSSENAVATANHPLSLILLENTPDFIHVVSLKGTFLYVAPSIRRVLGYEPHELVGKCMADLAHPEDVVPLMRELKESSVLGPSQSQTQDQTATSSSSLPSPSSSTLSAAPSTLAPRTVDLLFRVRTKGGTYVWIECRGRLHVEPGKGRKAIVLSGRAKEMARLEWGSIARAGGLARPMPLASTSSTGSAGFLQREFWGMLSDQGQLLIVGSGVGDILGWNAADLIGRNIGGLVVEAGEEEGMRNMVKGEIAMMVRVQTREWHGNWEEQPLVRSMFCRMRRKDSGCANVQIVLYHGFRAHRDSSTFPSSLSISPASIIYQIKLADRSASTTSPAQLMHSLTANVFEELETSRNSSWQYELQQLKFANQRLADEIEALEGVVSQLPPPSHPPPPMQPSYVPPSERQPPQQTTASLGGEQRRLALSMMQAPSRDWMPAQQQQTRQYPHGLKRSWDTVDCGTS